MSSNNALCDAKRVVQFRELESLGLVRIRAEEEQEAYFDVYGEPEGYTDQYGKIITPEEERKQIIESIELNGCWYLVAEYRLDENDEWEMADSIGMNVGYDDPTSPYENWYVSDLMASAIEKIETSTPEYSI